MLLVLELGIQAKAASQKSCGADFLVGILNGKANES